MSDTLISNLEIGSKVTEFYSLRKIEMRSYDGKPFAKIELGDRTGRIQGTYWGDDTSDIYDELKSSKAVKVRGAVTEHHCKKSLKIYQIRVADSDEIDSSRLIPLGKLPPEEYYKKYCREINKIKEPFLLELFDKILNDVTISSKILVTPAGKLWHHNYQGGFLEHSMCVAKICRISSMIHEIVNRDLLITGALLHDIGKVFELEVTFFADYTETGRLLGHVYIGASYVEKMIDTIPDFPDDLKKHLIHLILSHHGTPEMGSNIKPLSIEASILHNADHLDSEAAAFTRVVNKELPSGDDFSNWVNLADRFLYLKPYRKEEE